MARPKPDDDDDIVPPVLVPGCVALALSLIGIVLGLILLRSLLNGGNSSQSLDAEFIIGAILVCIGIMLGLAGIASCIYVHKYKGGEVKSYIERRYVEHRLSVDTVLPEIRSRFQSRIAPLQEESSSSHGESENGDNTDNTHISQSSEDLVNANQVQNTNELLTPPVDFNSSRRLSPFVIDVTSLRRSSSTSLRRMSSTETDVGLPMVEPPGSVNTEQDYVIEPPSLSRNIPIVRVNSGPIPPPDQYSIQCDCDDGHLSDTAPSA